MRRWLLQPRRLALSASDTAFEAEHLRCEQRLRCLAPSAAPESPLPSWSRVFRPMPFSADSRQWLYPLRRQLGRTGLSLNSLKTKHNPLACVPHRSDQCADRGRRRDRSTKMKAFTIENETNNITLHATIQEAEAVA